MDTSPKLLEDMGRIAGLNSDQIKNKWFEVRRVSIIQFLNYILREIGLDDNQLQQFYALCQKTVKEKTLDNNIIELISPILDEKQKKQALRKFAVILHENTKILIIEIQTHMTMDQKQVFSAYQKVEAL